MTKEQIETKRNEKIEVAWKAHLARCKETQDALDKALEEHAKIHGPSLEQYQAEYSQVWKEYDEENSTKELTSEN